MENAEQASNSSDSSKLAYGLDRYAWNQGYNAKYDFQVFENEEPALVARGGSAVCCKKSVVDLPR